MKRKKSTSKHSLAAKADKYALYQQSVQTPEAEVSFFNRTFEQHFGRAPAVLREDFCGTAAVCCEWVKHLPERTAYGFDIDQEPLAWGQKFNVSNLDTEAQQRVHLMEQDVRDVAGPKGDIIAAQNFSFFTFRTRDALREYFRAARENLADEGMFILDIMGGSEVIEEDRRDETDHGKFCYIWEHKRFDPVTHSCTYAIHFSFKDGSKLKDAFTYDWRFWTIPEVRELLDEAGFSSTEVYWEGTGDDGEGDGEYSKCDSAPSDPAWVSYIVAFK